MRWMMQWNIQLSELRLSFLLLLFYFLLLSPLRSLIFTFCGRLIENSIFLVLLIIKMNSLSILLDTVTVLQSLCYSGIRLDTQTPRHLSFCFLDG